MTSNLGDILEDILINDVNPVLSLSSGVIYQMSCIHDRGRFNRFGEKLMNVKWLKI